MVVFKLGCLLGESLRQILFPLFRPFRGWGEAVDQHLCAAGPLIDRIGFLELGGVGDLLKAEDVDPWPIGDLGFFLERGGGGGEAGKNW